MPAVKSPPTLAEVKLAKLLELKRLHELKAERDRRARISRPRQWASPLDMAMSLDSTIVRTPALEVINQALVDLAEGRIPGNRLAVMIPPQEGKSTLCSYWNPLWLLSQVDPDLRVLSISYSSEMARRWGSDVKLALETYNGDEGSVDLGLRLRADTRAAGRWQIEGHRGGIYCAGVDGSITGKPADYIGVDDPLKSLEEAQSQKYRDRVMRTWQGVLIPRMAPGTKVVWIQTLWHEAEPIQQILQEHGKDWRVIRIPAIADSPDDPLGREIGEPMRSARGQRDWQRIRRDVGEYVFSALYQQRPAPAEGGLFKRIWWRYWSPGPGDYMNLGGKAHTRRDSWVFGTVDLAASTKTSSDYTVVCIWARTVSGDLVLLDRLRARIGEHQHFEHVRPLVDRYQVDTLFVEATHQNTTLVREATQSGVPITPLRAEQDKLSRALPASAWASSGRVWLPANASWLGEWLDETASFPNSAHDDQVDCLSYAVRVAVTKAAPRPAAPPVRTYQPRPEDVALGGHDVDLLNMQM